MERSSQIADLVDKLQLFNTHYNNLSKFISEGNSLLNSEKPVGETASRIEEQLETCQVCMCVSVLLASECSERDTYRGNTIENRGYEFVYIYVWTYVCHFVL